MTAWHRLLAVVVAILLLAAALRFHRLEAQSFWNDEGNSARLSERSVPAILEGTASDIHPPLYYLLLRGWRELGGETEFGLRSLSAYAGVLTVAVTMAIARRLVGMKGSGGAGERGSRESEASAGAALGRDDRSPYPATQGTLPTAHWSLITPFAGLFAAVSPVLVYYSQETRMYALLALLAALSAWALLVWLVRQEWRWAVAYVAVVAAGLYTHYFFPAVVAAQGMVVLVRGLQTAADGRRNTADRGLLSVVGRPLAAWLLFAITATALYLPWLPVFLRQVGGRSGERAGVLNFLVDSGRWLIPGSTTGADEVTWALWAALVLIVLGVVASLRHAAAVAPLVVVPLALMYYVGATDPAFFKFLLAVMPFVCLLMGLAWSVPRRWLWLPGVLTVVVLAGMAVSLANLYNDTVYARADYRAMAESVADDPGNAGVILVAPNQWEVFTYYHRDGAPVYPLPRSRPDPTLLVPELERIAATHDRLYVLYWGEGQRDPERVIERWLDGNTYKASEEWVGDVRFAVYAVPHQADITVTPSGATFAGLDGETITLKSYTVWPQMARPGEVVQAQLVWTADATPARPYKVFLHLIAADGSLVAQRDAEPVGGSRPTTTWMPGEEVVDNHGLLMPPDLPPGDYALRLGLYDAFDPAIRLAVEGADSLLLTTVTVAE